MPFEAIMVKRFRRSAAGYDEQLPQIFGRRATPNANDGLPSRQGRWRFGKMAVVHKFVWDRTSNDLVD